MNAFKRNLGLRIDHILLSSELASRCRSSSVHVDMRKLERPLTTHRSSPRSTLKYLTLPETKSYHESTKTPKEH